MFKVTVAQNAPILKYGIHPGPASLWFLLLIEFGMAHVLLSACTSVFCCFTSLQYIAAEPQGSAKPRARARTETVAEPLAAPFAPSHGW